MSLQNRPIALSGIRPTGDLHLGNYFGAIKSFVELQASEYLCLYFVADLHALTTAAEDRLDIDSASVEVVRWYLACGIDPSQSLVYRQSEIAEIPYLSLLLGMIAPEGELRRCTTYKDKVSDLEGKGRTISLGLLAYPVLMAADILFCNSSVVPVGEDQLQHLEITREIARRYNAHHSKKHRFIEPQPFALRTIRVPGLSGGSKMSKSAGGAEDVIFLRDSVAEVARKLKRAETDAGNSDGGAMSPALANLYQLLQLCAPESVYTQYVQMHATRQNGFYGQLKSDLARHISAMLAPIQDRFNSTECSAERVADYLASSATQVRKIARANLEAILDDMGFRTIARDRPLTRGN